MRNAGRETCGKSCSSIFLSTTIAITNSNDIIYNTQRSRRPSTDAGDDDDHGKDDDYIAKPGEIQKFSGVDTFIIDVTAIGVNFLLTQFERRQSF